MKKTVWELGAE